MMQIRSQYKLFLLTWIFIFALVLGSVSVRGTWATYSSQEVSGKNSLRGGSIELSASSIESDTVERGFVYEFKIKNDGYNSLRYQMVLSENDDDFCESLQLIAQRGEVTVYDGELSNFSYITTEALDRDENDFWKFSITLFEDISIPGNTSPSCAITLRLEAWQDRFLPLGMGWYDEREIMLPSMRFESADSEDEKVVNQEVPSQLDDTEVIEGNISQEAEIESASDTLPITEVDAGDAGGETSAAVQDREALPVE